MGAAGGAGAGETRAPGAAGGEPGAGAGGEPAAGGEPTAGVPAARTLARAWLAVGAWMVVIFLLSAQQSEDSAALSGSLLQVVGEVLDGVIRALGGEGLSAGTSAVLHSVLRKTAHVVAYLILGALTARAVTMGDRARTSRNPALPVWLLAWLIATAYAVTDEVHQLFVPGRGGQATDVLLDSAGALVGVWAFLHGARRRGRWSLDRPQ